MTNQMSFATILETFVQRDGRRVRQLSQSSAQQFGSNQYVPHNTISRWVSGAVKKPRNWQDILKLAIVLHLEINEVDQLLTLAGHPHLASLRQASVSKADAELINYWHPLPPIQQGTFQAPPMLQTFTGRHEVRKNIATLLIRSQTQRLCCLQGMAGVGKTSLAIQLAYDLRHIFTDGVLWARLDRSNTMAILYGFAAAFQLDVTQYPDIESRSSKVRELLVYKKALIVLDNATSDEQVYPLLPPTGACAVIITTRREDLAIADQTRRFYIKPFHPTTGESLLLLEKVLGKERVGVEQTDLQILANLLGHLPLALDIAANRLRHEPNWSTPDFIQQLQQDKNQLAALTRGDRAVRLSFSLSFRALPKEQQHLFAALSAFVSSFSCAAVATICNGTSSRIEKQLQQLQTLSLVQPAPNGRYQLHPLLRLYGQELDQDPQTAVRMVHYYLNDLILQQNHSEQTYEQLDLEAPNILNALETAIDNGITTHLVPAITKLYPYFNARGDFDTAHRWLKAAEEIAQADKDQLGLTAVFDNLGHIALKQGDSQQAERLYQQALDIARQTNNLTRLSSLLMKLGALAHRRSQFKVAKEKYTEALAVARQAHDQNRVAATLANLGLLAAVQGERETAVRYYHEALPLARHLNNNNSIISILQNLGALADEQGNYAQAKTYFQEGLDLANKLGSPELRSRLLGNLGLVACALENYAEAAAHFREGLALAEQANLTLQVSRQRANLGKVAMHRRRYTRANYHYQEALALARQLGFPEDIATILNQWGECQLAQQTSVEAEKSFREALQIAERANLRSEHAKSLFGLAHTAAQRDNIILARQLGQQAQQIFAQIGHTKANEVSWWLAELPNPFLNES